MFEGTKIGNEGLASRRNQSLQMIQCNGSQRGGPCNTYTSAEKVRITQRPKHGRILGHDQSSLFRHGISKQDYDFNDVLYLLTHQVTQGIPKEKVPEGV